jgi:hypothetical protein
VERHVVHLLEALILELHFSSYSFASLFIKPSRMTSHVQPPVPSMRRFACETRVVSGLGCIKSIGAEIKYYKIEKPALVVDVSVETA